MKLLIEKGANYETGRGSEGAARRVMFACEASKKSGLKFLIAECNITIKTFGLLCSKQFFS